MSYKNLIGFLCFLIATSAYPQECSQILHQGIYDFRSSASSFSAYSSFASWFCSKKFSSEQEAENFGSSVAFPFKGVPVKLGFDSSSQNWSQWYSSFCGSVQNSTSIKSSISTHLQTINPRVLDAFNKCISAGGLHVWLELTGDPKVFVFAAKYNPLGINVNTATIDSFDTGHNVRCKEAPTTVSASAWRTRCNRLDDRLALLVVNADSNPIGSGNLKLPEITRPTLPSPKKTYVICSCEGHVGVPHTYWGHRGTTCNGVPAWGTYSQNCKNVSELCACVGTGYMNGMTFYGPRGAYCNIGAGNNGAYGGACIDISEKGLGKCKVNVPGPPAHAMNDMDIWGPAESYCAGFSSWGVYR